MFPRHSAYKIRRNLRRICKRLSKHFRQLRDHAAGILLRNIQLRVIRSQMCGNLPRHIRLVIFLIPHTYGKTSDTLCRQRLHQRHHRAAVNPCRKESSYRHIRHHLPPDRLFQQPFQFLRRFRLTSPKRIRFSPLCSLRHRPVRLSLILLKRISDLQYRPRLQLINLFIDRTGCRNIPIPEILLQNSGIYGVIKSFQRSNGIQIRGKYKFPPACKSIV